MDDLISRQKAIMDAESWGVVDEYEKHLQKNVIEWLKEFPPAELGTDTISRQAAAELVMKYCPDDDGAVQCDGDIRGLLDELENLPSAQPERQRGEWIEISSINHTYKCSECGRLLVNITDGRNNVSKHYPYCHCGADMRGEQQK